MAGFFFQQRILSRQQLFKWLVLIDKDITFEFKRGAYFQNTASFYLVAKRTMIKRSYFIWLALLPLTVIVLCGGCKEKAGAPDSSLNSPNLTGTWMLQSRIIEGVTVPAKDKIIRLQLDPGGKFQAFYKGEESQDWIRAGQGGFSYAPPKLTLHWESGQALSLLVQDKDPEHIFVHHGRNMVPLNNQEPDEIFVKQATNKAPGQ